MRGFHLTVPIKVWASSEIDTSPDVSPSLTSIMKWINSYIVRPHPELGRDGVVCPYVPTALKMKTLWLAEVRALTASPAEMCGIVRAFMDIYNSLEPRDGEWKQFKSLVLAFPNIGSNAPELIAGVHFMMKPTVVSAGLMLGEFYTRNDSPGLHNPAFRPLQSAVPLFVFRQIVANDIAFLTKPSDPPERRFKFVCDYLRHLKDKLPEDRLRQAEHELTQARLQLRQSSFALRGSTSPRPHNPPPARVFARPISYV